MTCLSSTITRSRQISPRGDLAGAAAETPAPLWAGRESRDAVVVCSRLADVLVDRHPLDPASLPPGTVPELGGELAVVPATGVQHPPLAVSVPFAGVAWLAMLRRVDWSPNTAEAKADLVYEIQFRR